MVISTLPQPADALDAALDRDFGGLADAPALLLAVSGGPDSMVLMHLAATWAKRLAAKPKLNVATVDHALRPGSANEADMVAAAAAALGLPHAILSWAGPKPTSRLQEKARAARYGLLADHARQVGASHVLTAHHADDQAETVLFRLGRGSGIGGLAGMRRLSPLEPGLWLCRPLLGRRKAELVDFCDTNAIRYVDDPSNHDPAFARTRLRARGPALAQLGIDTLGLVRLARRLARADEALEAQTDRIERALQPSRSPGGYSVDLKSTMELAPELALRLLGRAIAHVAGDVTGSPRTIRLERLEALTEAVQTALRVGTAHRGTLAGTRVVLGADGHLCVTREPRRRRGMASDPAAFNCPD